MLNKLITEIVCDKLDWFFVKDLRNQYDKRRETLLEAKTMSIPVIDYILQNYVDPNAIYPPPSTSVWLNYVLTPNESDKNQVIKQILLIYLKLDIGNYLTQKETSTRTRTKDKNELSSLECAFKGLSLLSEAFDFRNSIIHLSNGLWATDNEQLDLMTSSLCSPSISLEDYFTSPREMIRLIIDSLVISHLPRMALFMSRVYKYDPSNSDFDNVHCFLLLITGKLSEALKYTRIFSDKDNYHEVLERFFYWCSEYDFIKSIKCLNLSEEEEEYLNEILTTRSSRPVTPSGTQDRQTDKTSRTSTPKNKSRNRNIQSLQRNTSISDSPARNTRSARKKKTG